MKTFVDNLKNIREQLGLTQKEFAEKLGFNFRSVSNWETGKCYPSLVTIQKIHKLFKVDYEDLFDFSEEE